MPDVVDKVPIYFFLKHTPLPQSSLVTDADLCTVHIYDLIMTNSILNFFIAFRACGLLAGIINISPSLTS